MVYLDNKKGLELLKLILVSLDCNCLNVDELCQLRQDGSMHSSTPIFIVHTLSFKCRNIVEPCTQVNLSSFVKYVDKTACKTLVAGYVGGLQFKCVQITDKD